MLYKRTVQADTTLLLEFITRATHHTPLTIQVTMSLPFPAQVATSSALSTVSPQALDSHNKELPPTPPQYDSPPIQNGSPEQSVAALPGPSSPVAGRKRELGSRDAHIFVDQGKSARVGVHVSRVLAPGVVPRSLILLL